MMEVAKVRIPVQLPMEPSEERKIRLFCKKTGANLGRLATIALLEYIERNGK